MCKRFLRVSCEGSPVPCRSCCNGTRTAPLTAGVTIRVHRHCTSSQRTCLRFNFTLVYLSVRLVPFFFLTVFASLRPYIMACPAPPPAALAHCIKSNLAGWGLLLSFFLLCLLLCVYFHPPPSLYFRCSILSLPRACSCPSYCPDFHFPHFRRVPRRSEPPSCLLRAGPAHLIAGCSPVSSSVGVEQEITWLLCSWAVNCLPAEKVLWKPAARSVNNLTLKYFF